MESTKEAILSVLDSELRDSLKLKLCRILAEQLDEPLAEWEQELLNSTKVESFELQRLETMFRTFAQECRTESDKSLATGQHIRIMRACEGVWLQAADYLNSLRGTGVCPERVDSERSEVDD